MNRGSRENNRKHRRKFKKTRQKLRIQVSKVKKTKSIHQKMMKTDPNKGIHILVTFSTIEEINIRP